MFANPSEDIPIRLHYLIQEGRLNLPPAARLQVIQEKRELQAMLRFLGRWYIHLLCHGRLEEADQTLLMFRGLQELRFSELFEAYGYPDELTADPALADWLGLAEEIGEVP